VLSFKSKFAVGKPIVRPNCSPFTTVPESSKGLFKKVFATSTAPSNNAVRILVELTAFQVKKKLQLNQLNKS
jgi:hypothetical protein